MEEEDNTMKIAVKILAGMFIVAGVSAVVFSGTAFTKPEVSSPILLGVNSEQNIQVNGVYDISVWTGSVWRKAGSLAFDRFFRERWLDLAEYLPAGETARIKITEKAAEPRISMPCRWVGPHRMR